MLLSLAVAAAVIGSAAAQSTAPQWGQCGGTGWTGPTTCPSGWVCTYSNPWYSQCLQGTGSTTSTTSTTSKSTTTSTTSTKTSTTSTSTTTSSTTTIPTTSIGGTSTGTAAGLGPTLVSTNLWIRADEQPNFHKYLQSSVINTPGPAVLGDYTTAAQFQLINGQLIQELAGGQVLYLNVDTSNATTGTYLATYFATTPATVGAFAWQGDGLTWTAPNIARQNIGAWLACGTGVPGAYINLGAYDYMTPTGCADQTLNYYNGATAVD